MSQSNFFAMLSRMKYINRWGLMNNTRYENISEHSQQVAVLAHCLVLIHNKRFGGSLDPERAALLAVFHDATEIITGDMPTPVKYANRDIRDIYRDIEDKAADRLTSMLPEDFRGVYSDILKQCGDGDDKLRVFVKAADRFSALIKCIDEMRMGNDEFAKAKETIEKSIREMNLPEAEVFEKEFLPAFSLPLDELS
ncbi:5'-deoxynucleotidase [Ruminococcus sp.]|uniref:5'-deoxynucleotidase n=1 Tax=Ruminococcus sp. TaxID=41978 RepID=UPI002E78B588|nr:5'-deoxynucleotidase [Ruminococcus sp.]MEE1261761.1 5'-deoxynucleotidase [Ruminococcus sp.]